MVKMRLLSAKKGADPLDLVVRVADGKEPEGVLSGLVATKEEEYAGRANFRMTVSLKVPD